VVGYASIKASLAEVAMKSNPMLAHDLAPGNGQIAGRLAWRLVARPDATAIDRARANKLAREALRHDATAVSAVATLGMDARQRRDLPDAHRIFGYAEKLSRRSLAAQIWAVEDAARKEDVAGVLHHFDIALRTSEDAPGALYPGLTKALMDARIRSEMARTLSRRPGWGEDFLNYVVQNSPDPRMTVSLLSDLQRRKFPVSAEAHANAANSLIAKNFVTEAWSYYAANNPGVDRLLSRDPEFSFSPRTPTLFDWNATNDNGITASIDQGAFDFQVPATMSGVILRQLQLLKPGTYRLEGQSAELEQQTDELPYWALTCTDGRELGRLVVPNSTDNGGKFAGLFTVPADCPVQILGLVARSSDVVGGASGQILRAQLAPAAPSKAHR
jgi:hypothetical protein